ncbi:MAG: hypothetical protein DRH90_06035 [Deltaproteobacteria bacterium]|nr:MAG: hypothetical protein DRH90_06035 [Deltaproteobacteria bacterium]RLC17371.1 MAG: hypothetical protein DRI24_05905 [Deltaproteobacteria bacterium]
MDQLNGLLLRRNYAQPVRQGNGSKEIAFIRNLSHKTVERYRENIRNKLGIKNKSTISPKFFPTIPILNR